MYVRVGTRNIMALQRFFVIFCFCFLFTCFFLFVLPLLFLFLVHMCPCLYVLCIFATLFYFPLGRFCLFLFACRPCCAGVWNQSKM